MKFKLLYASILFGMVTPSITYAQSNIIGMMDEQPLINNLLGSLKGQSEFIQNSTVMPYGNEEKHHQKLVSERESLFLFTPESPLSEDNALFLTAYLNGKKIKKIKLARPDLLPRSDQPEEDTRPRVEYSTRAWSSVLAWDWMKPGLQLEISDQYGQTSLLEAEKIEWSAPSDMIFQMMRVGLLAEPREINGLEKEPLRLGMDYFNKIPVASLTLSSYLPVYWDHVVLMDGTIYTDASADTGSGHGGDMREQIAKNLISVGINNANFGIASAFGNSTSQPEYFNQRVIHQAVGMYSNGYVTHGWSGGNGMLTMYNTTGNEFSHEGSHSYGQVHYLNDGKYASHNIDSGWDYDIFHRRLIANIDWKAVCDTETDCINEFSEHNLKNNPDYQTYPFKGIYRYGTDAQADGHQSSSISDYTYYTAFSNESIQQYLTQRASLDNKSPSGYTQWNAVTNKMEPLVDPLRLTPTATGVPVATLVGFYDPENKINGYAYPPMISNYGTTFDYLSAGSTKCDAQVDFDHADTVHFGVIANKSSNDTMNKFHVNVPLESTPNHISITCPKSNDLEIQYEQWILDYFSIGELHNWNETPDHSGIVGDIYAYSRNGDIEYWRLKDTHYGYYPAKGYNNTDWEYLDSKDVLYSNFSEEYEPSEFVVVLDSNLVMPAELPPTPVHIGRGQGFNDMSLPTIINYNVTSENYAVYTPSGNDRVFFYIPEQTGITVPDEANNATNGQLISDNEGTYTSFVANLTDEQDQQQSVILRMQKLVWGQWRSINDATGSGQGQVKVYLDLADNPGLNLASHLTGRFSMQVQSYDNSGFSRKIDIVLDINLKEHHITSTDLIGLNFIEQAALSNTRVFFYVPEQDNIVVPTNIDSSQDGYLGSTMTNDYSVIKATLSDKNHVPYSVNLRLSRSIFGSQQPITDARDNKNAKIVLEFNPLDNVAELQGKYLSGAITLVMNGYDDRTLQDIVNIDINLDTTYNTLGKWSRNFALDTSSGISSVYFYTPTGQHTVTAASSERASDGRWGSPGDYSTVTARLKSTNGGEKDVVLRGYKENYGKNPLSEGMQGGHGQYMLEYLPEDNPSVISNDYLYGDIKIAAQGWHDKAFKAVSTSQIAINTITSSLNFESSQGTYISPTYSGQDNSALYFIIPHQEEGVTGPKSSTMQGKVNGSNGVTLWLTDELTGLRYVASLKMQKVGCSMWKMNDITQCEMNDPTHLKVQFLPQNNENLPQGAFSGQIIVNLLDSHDSTFIQPITLNVSLSVIKDSQGHNITDTDGDGVDDINDIFPQDYTETVDSDGDGAGDNGDAFPNDVTESLDTDGDGIGDNVDTFPHDPQETVDSDGDGVGDNGDDFPNDPSKSDLSDIQMALTSDELIHTNFITFTESGNERIFFYIPDQPSVEVAVDIDEPADGTIDDNVLTAAYSTITMNMTDINGYKQTVALRVSRTSLGGRNILADARDARDATVFFEYFSQDNPGVGETVLTGSLDIYAQGYDDPQFMKQVSIALSLDTQTYTLGKWSRNYSLDTPDMTSVYFYTPFQAHIIASDSDEDSDKKWGTTGSYTQITALLDSADGTKKQVILRGHKDLFGNKPMNEGMQKEAGSFMVEYQSIDNPELGVGEYLTGRIQVVGHGWHDKNYQVSAWVNVVVDTTEKLYITTSQPEIVSIPIPVNDSTSLYYTIGTNQELVDGPTQGIWNGSTEPTLVSVPVTHTESGKISDITLRLYKKGCMEFQMNDGVYCSQNDLEQLKVLYQARDNLTLAAGSYQGTFIVTENAWENADYARSLSINLNVIIEQ